jgi:hypothetical protein
MDLFNGSDETMQAVRRCAQELSKAYADLELTRESSASYPEWISQQRV